MDSTKPPALTATTGTLLETSRQQSKNKVCLVTISLAGTHASMSIRIEWHVVGNNPSAAAHALHALDQMMATIVAHETLTEDTGPPLPTITSAELESIAPSKSWTKRMPNAPCAICMEEMKLRKRVRQLPCGHTFCSRCIRKWVVSEHSCCPVCRDELSK